MREMNVNVSFRTQFLRSASLLSSIGHVRSWGYGLLSTPYCPLWQIICPLHLIKPGWSAFFQYLYRESGTLPFRPSFNGLDWQVDKPVRERLGPSVSKQTWRLTWVQSLKKNKSNHSALLAKLCLTHPSMPLGHPVRNSGRLQCSTWQLISRARVVRSNYPIVHVLGWWV